MTTLTTPTPPTAVTTSSTTRTCDPGTALTRSLLGWGVVVGPAYVASITAQALTRDGFDPLVHPASMLALGPYGWLQTVTFVLAGLMIVAASVGMRRQLGGGRAGVWGPRLVAVWGVAVLASAALPLDPAMGFPAGAPEGAGEMSWHGIGHLVAGGIGFPAMAAAIVVVGRRFRARGDTASARFSTGCAVVFAVLYVVSLTQLAAPYTTPVFTAAVVTLFAWLSVTSAALYRRAGRP